MSIHVVFKQIYINKQTNVFSCLTLILGMWRIWWAPNNASKWQMGINSGFKGIRTFMALELTPSWGA